MKQIARDEQFVPGFVWKGFLRPISREDLLEDKIQAPKPEEPVKEEG